MINTKRHQKVVESIVKQCTDHGLDDIGQCCLNNALVKIFKRLELAEVRAAKAEELAAQTNNTTKG
jgi:cystathionine beta-lyase family protein involved in aluminum resistance